MSVFHIKIKSTYSYNISSYDFVGRSCMRAWSPLKKILFMHIPNMRGSEGWGWVGELRRIIVFGGEGGRGLYFPGGGIKKN